MKCQMSGHDVPTIPFYWPYLNPVSQFQVSDIQYVLEISYFLVPSFLDPRSN
jgi:hypothetical protein